MAAEPPDAFLSYTRFDDRRGDISAFCRHLEEAVREVTGESFEIFQDVDDIEIGDRWSDKLDEMLAEARFFIPILTPNYFRSQACRDELQKFLKAEKAKGRGDLVLPVYYIEWDILEDAELRDTDPLAMEIHRRQHHDWRKLRHSSFSTKAVKIALHNLARAIGKARRRPIASVPEPQHAQEPDEPAKAPLTRGTVFRDIDAPWCPELVVILPGEFMMGSPEDDAEADDREKPRHRVRIAYALAVGRHLVTYAEYDHFCQSSGEKRPKDWGWGRGRRPVTGISWEDANGYVAWLSKETRQPYRLLSEAEWEYAARAGTTTRYSWGDDITPENANYRGNNFGKTTEVGSYPANPWGLYDMHGNVWEWVEDCFSLDYQGAPSDGSARIVGHCSDRMVRGGAWKDGPSDLRSARRAEYSTGIVGRMLGFRVARTLPRSERVAT